MPSSCTAVFMPRPGAKRRVVCAFYVKQYLALRPLFFLLRATSTANPRYGRDWTFGSGRAPYRWIRFFTPFLHHHRHHHPRPPRSATQGRSCVFYNISSHSTSPVTMYRPLNTRRRDDHRRFSQPLLRTFCNVYIYYTRTKSTLRTDDWWNRHSISKSDPWVEDRKFWNVHTVKTVNTRIEIMLRIECIKNNV